MDLKILDTLMDPVDGKILLEIHMRSKASVRQLCEACPQIPRSTMYRHLARLQKDGLVAVVETVQKRGAVEKTYAIVDSAVQADPGVFDKEMVMSTFVQYCLTSISELRRYLDSTDAEVKDLRCGFSAIPVCASDDELQRILMSINRILSELAANPATSDRRMYTVGVVTMPSASNRSPS